MAIKLPSARTKSISFHVPFIHSFIRLDSFSFLNPKLFAFSNANEQLIQNMNQLQLLTYQPKHCFSFNIFRRLIMLNGKKILRANPHFIPLRVHVFFLCPLIFILSHSLELTLSVELNVVENKTA